MTFDPNLVWKVEAGWRIHELRWVLGFWYGLAGEECGLSSGRAQALQPCQKGKALEQQGISHAGQAQPAQPAFGPAWA